MVYFGVIASLVSGVIGLASVFAIERMKNFFEIQYIDTELKTEITVSHSLKQQITEADRELAAKQRELADSAAELTVKQSQLSQANQDLETKDRELAASDKKIKEQLSQLSANASELTKLRVRPPLFNFQVESSTLSNVETKKNAVKDLVTNAYDVIEEIYSRPYLLNSVTISFVNALALPNAAAEIDIVNSKQGLVLTIKLKDFDSSNFDEVNAVIHEIIHAFHGLAVLDPPAFEEGITVAATDAVMARLISQKKIVPFSPLYIRISTDDYLHDPNIVPRDAALFYTGPNVARDYQLCGFGWYQLYRADANFFKAFNEKIYAQKQRGNDITEAMAIETIKDVVGPNIGNMTTADWMRTKAFSLR